jgi:hypothetical protein
VKHSIARGPSGIQLALAILGVVVIGFAIVASPWRSPQQRARHMAYSLVEGMRPGMSLVDVVDRCRGRNLPSYRAADGSERCVVQGPKTSRTRVDYELIFEFDAANNLVNAKVEELKPGK